MSRPEPAPHRLCRLDEIIDGHSRGFDPGDTGRDTIFVVRRGTAVFAYRNDCPHYAGARMAWKKDQFLNADRSRIMCGAHGALFRIEDGFCDLGPCLGLSLTRVPIAIESGEIRLRHDHDDDRHHKPISDQDETRTRRHSKARTKA